MGHKTLRILHGIVRPTRITNRPESSPTVIWTIFGVSIEPSSITVQVPGNTDYLLATWPRKDGDPERMLWLCVPKGSCYLSTRTAPYEARHLSMNIYSRETGSRMSMKEVNASVI